MKVTQAAYARHAGLSRQRVSRLVSEGMPLDSLQAADTWRLKRAKIPSKVPRSKGKPRRSRRRLPQGTGPRSAYVRLEQAEVEAYKIATAAIAAGTADAARLLAVHAQTVRNLAELRQTILQLEQEERNLVSGTAVRHLMQQHDGVLANLIRAMPRQLAGRICPLDPEHAEAELSRWVNEVFLNTLQRTDPWK